MQSATRDFIVGHILRRLAPPLRRFGIAYRARQRHTPYNSPMPRPAIKRLNRLKRLETVRGETIKTFPTIFRRRCGSIADSAHASQVVDFMLAFRCARWCNAERCEWVALAGGNHSAGVRRGCQTKGLEESVAAVASSGRANRCLTDCHLLCLSRLLAPLKVRQHL